MPYFTQVGHVPRKRHVAFRQPDGSLYWEELIGEDGFVGDTSLLYHRNPPSALTAIETVETPDEGLHPNQPLSPIHLTPHSLPIKGDAVLDRVLLLSNDDVRISYAVATEDSSLYKNSTGDELAYVESGSGALESTFGRIEIVEGDYVIVPTSTIHRWTVRGDDELRLLFVEARGHIDPPKRYLSERGQFIEGTPYCELDIRRPTELLDESGSDVPVIVRTRTGLTRNVHKHHPFDVVGWHGGMYPWSFSIHDFEPITGSLHQPPPMHQILEAPGFVMCNFVPRLLDYNPNAVPIPPFHSNVDSDEVLFYAKGQAKTRQGTGVGLGSITVHPAGFIHGPHPGNVERALGAARADEYQVMVDTHRPLQLSAALKDCVDPEYPFTWANLEESNAGARKVPSDA
ncbi:homogentisate 1,2-dioxygenase [Rhodococcus opacus PD630]|uniref:homogentisate 1,2-dioxygenase n=1 Tax=Rhodococcus opacus TaxID=37919 RepID=UPI00029CCEBE|nr:cupin domain-containing protein [Rhodococcus opacus]NDV09724.1 homogentisate 1,2-dioxygenase [Rhodococcus sp. IEGM 248]AHK35739.1 Putative dioxygenase [Rhodococcus opacus PD630]EHI43340.1 homogentisate 1,2-dioxygenase [Rhodococcus opacus PD630]MDJ0418852.1 homogentisate 1,2-dioxygenase [Rhodococcus opacus]QZS52428.1 homogentisate 1,2-dioxygenase [Rhodococcus opacus]